MPSPAATTEAVWTDAGGMTLAIPCVFCQVRRRRGTHMVSLQPVSPRPKLPAAAQHRVKPLAVPGRVKPLPARPAAS